MGSNSDTILIVEDDELTVTLFHHMLRHSCTNVVSLSSSKLDHLYEAIQTHQPMLIIFDFMSIRRNYDMVRDLLKLLVPHIPSVIMTSIDDDSLSDSFNYVIRKPFYKSDIFMIIQDVIQGSF